MINVVWTFFRLSFSAENVKIDYYENEYGDDYNGVTDFNTIIGTKNLGSMVIYNNGTIENNLPSKAENVAFELLGQSNTFPFDNNPVNLFEIPHEVEQVKEERDYIDDYWL